MENITGNRFSRAVTTALGRSRWELVGLAILSIMIAGTVTRIILLGAHFEQVSDDLWRAPAALVLGTIVDLFVALVATLPFLSFLLIMPDKWLRSKVGRGLMHAAFFVLFYAVLYLGVTEYFFFDEYNSRFNYVAVDYLIYPHEVFVNLWESYPVLQALILVGVLSVAALLLLRGTIRQMSAYPSPWRKRLLLWVGQAALVTLGFFALTINSQRLSSNRVLNEITGNGLYSFFYAFYTNELDYDIYYATIDSGEAARRCRELVATSQSKFLNTDLAVPIARTISDSLPSLPYNIVLIVEESFGSKFIGSLHPEGPSITPRFDSLAADGMLFTKIYATGNRTVRGLEAALASFPPIPGRSIIKRPGGEHVFTLPELLKDEGYQTAFLYGGHAYFDNIGRFATTNGYDAMIDQTKMPKATFSTIWGVCDEDLFAQTIATCDSLAALGRPFFATALTVSNHTPFTFPDHRIPFDPDKRKREYAVRYADFAFGEFIENARSHDFFDRTLFVFMADHGARVYGSQQIPMDSYEIPILFYSPTLIPQGVREDQLGSQMDLAPTILDLLNKDYASEFFGRSLLSTSPDREWALMSHNRDVAMLRNNRLAVLGVQKGIELWQRDPGSGAFSLLPGAEDSTLVLDAIAYFQTAFDMFNHHHLSPLSQPSQIH
jgi:phosphoglycerol transferase MdoB-like AlkP superfamily enzyme